MPEQIIAVNKAEKKELKKPNYKAADKELNKPNYKAADKGLIKKPKYNKKSFKEESPLGLFQGVGVIECNVCFGKEEVNVEIGGYKYPLLYLPKQWYKLSALKKEIENSGTNFKRLIVYPRVIHLPDKNAYQQVQFQLVRFEKNDEYCGITEKLNHNEFLIGGIWQFIPVCKLPCISVFKNYDEEKKEWIKQADKKDVGKYMKASHFPMIWRDSPIKPFKYNPKVETQEDQKYFVRIKANFRPDKAVFQFDTLVEPPTEDIPRYFKKQKHSDCEKP